MSSNYSAGARHLAGTRTPDGRWQFLLKGGSDRGHRGRRRVCVLAVCDTLRSSIRIWVH